MSDSYVARWSREDGKRLIITDRAGNDVDTLAIPPNGGDQPGLLMLSGTAWCVYPGSEWDEEPPGHWSVAVFSDELLHKNDGRSRKTGKV